MDVTDTSLQPILILLAAAVLAVVLCRLVALPPIIGYLAVGLALGPHALGAVPDEAQTEHLPRRLAPHPRNSRISATGRIRICWNDASVMSIRHKN